jgi:hypothetical protein
MNPARRGAFRHLFFIFILHRNNKIKAELNAALGCDEECKIFKDSPPGGRLFWLSRPKKEAKKCGFVL